MTVSRTRRLLVGTTIGFALVATACSSGSSESKDPGTKTAAATSAPAASGSAATSASSATDTPSASSTESETPSETGAAATGTGADGAKIAYLSASSANTWLKASLAEMQKVADKNGMEIVEFDAQFDPSLQNSQFQDAIAAGDYDGIILVSLNGVASAPDVQAAADAGIPVVALNQVVGEDFKTAKPQIPGIDASVMAPPYQNGKRMGQLAVKACEGVDPCKIAYIYGLKGIPLDEALRSGFNDAIAGNANMSVAAEGEGKYLGPDGGLKATQDILNATPDINVIVGADQSIQGAEIAVKDEGKLDKIKLIGLGGSAPALKAIADGQWFAGVYGAPGDEGRDAMEQMVSILNGGPTGVGIDPLESVTDNGLVTADNVSKFEAQWDG